MKRRGKDSLARLLQIQRKEKNVAKRNRSCLVCREKNLPVYFNSDTVEACRSTWLIESITKITHTVKEMSTCVAPIQFTELPREEMEIASALWKIITQTKETEMQYNNFAWHIDEAWETEKVIFRSIWQGKWLKIAKTNGFRHLSCLY